MAEDAERRIAAAKRRYPELADVWAKRPPCLRKAEDSDLRYSGRWINHSQLLDQAVLNIVTWMDVHTLPLDTAAISSGVIKDQNGCVCGYDFLMHTPPMIPRMLDNGAFPMRYAQILPALMLTRFMKVSKTPNVDTTVLCWGYGYDKKQEWWHEASTTTPEDAARFLVESGAFKAYVGAPASSKSRRLCVWVPCRAHVFMVVWEQGLRYDMIYFADNAVGVADIDAFRKRFLTEFQTQIEDHREQKDVMREMFDRSILSPLEVEIQPDLVCVSFMARCTAYLNTMDLSLDKGAVGLIVKNADVRFQAFCYAEFEKALVAFLTQCLIGPNNRCVWLPPVLQHKFININDICLLTVDPDEKDATATRFEFLFGGGSSFEPVSDTSVCAEGSGCTVSTEFLQTAIDQLRECRKALDTYLRRETTHTISTPCCQLPA